MLPTIKKVKLIEKKNLIIIILDLNHEVFIIYIAYFNIISDISIEIYLRKMLK